MQPVSGKNTDDFITNSQEGAEISSREESMTSSSMGLEASETALLLTGNFYSVFQNCFRRF